MYLICWFVARHLTRKWNETVEIAPNKLAELQELEESLQESDLPLDEWKKEEKAFIDAVVQQDASKNITRSPYQPREDKGQFYAQHPLISMSPTNYCGSW